jgi:hypothetical protein
MIPDGLTIARAPHVLAIVRWTGGVSAVTTIVLPHARRLGGATGLEAFEAFASLVARPVITCGRASIENSAWKHSFSKRTHFWHRAKLAPYDWFIAATIRRLLPSQNQNN